VKQIFFISLFSLTLFILGCESESTLKEDSNFNTMSVEMPSDFDFIVEFGVLKKNVFNTYEDTVTKDLITDGTATTNLTFTTEEMESIYQEMKDVNITEMKNLVPETNCGQQPFSEDEWKITINGEVITHAVSGRYCETTNDAKQLIELRNYVFSLVKNKEEYKKLPEAKGGYK
jgi:archaellum component FlaF (FlaF/FlaG flagellin family)